MPHILLIEDDQVIGSGVKSYLESVSVHQITWIDHGKEAQAALSESHGYDCILLDLNLPGVEGVEILKTLRAYDSTTPVLIVTANDFAEVRAACEQAGATDFLVKPFDLIKLAQCIHTYLPDPSTADLSSTQLGWGDAGASVPIEADS